MTYSCIEFLPFEARVAAAVSLKTFFTLSGIDSRYAELKLTSN